MALSDFAVIVGVLVVIQIVLFPFVEWWLKRQGWWPDVKPSAPYQAWRDPDDKPPEGCTVDKCVDHPHAKQVTILAAREALAHARTFTHFNPTALANLSAALDAWERADVLVRDITSTPGMLSRTEAYERIQRWIDAAREIVA